MLAIQYSNAVYPWGAYDVFQTQNQRVFMASTMIATAQLPNWDGIENFRLGLYK